MVSLFRLGTIERHDGNSAAARESFTDLRTILERWSAAAPGDPAVRVLLGTVLDHEANVLFDQGLAHEAEERLEQALVLLRSAPGPVTSGKESREERRAHRDVRYVLGLVPEDGDVRAEERRWRSEALWDLARVLRALKRPEEAEKVEGQRVGLWKEARPASWSTWLSSNWIEP